MKKADSESFAIFELVSLMQDQLIELACLNNPSAKKIQGLWYILKNANYN